ncbi:unnamed protein product, partial [Polarella glacialis]
KGRTSKRRACSENPKSEDPHGWLEELESAKVQAWVEAQNASTLQRFGNPKDSPLFRRLLQTETTDQDQDPLRKLPQVTELGGFFYDFWMDPLHQRGVWRRTSLEDFLKTADPDWEEVLSLDELCAEERESWVWRGFEALIEEAEGRCSATRVMLRLSRGGADAFVAREFDLSTKRFVAPAAGGFVVPEAKSVVSFRSRDELLVSTDFGPSSLTAAGYPRTVRAWLRGTPLSSAEVVYEGQQEDHVVYGYSVRQNGGLSFEVLHRGLSFHAVEWRLSLNCGKSFAELRAPPDAELSFFGRWILLRLGASGFKAGSGAGDAFPAGALLAADATCALAGQSDCWEVVWEPEVDGKSFQEPGEPTAGTPRFSTLQNVVATQNYLVLVVLSRVRSSLLVLRPPSTGQSDGDSAASPSWQRVASRASEGDEVLASLSVRPVDPRGSDALWVGRASQTQPPELFWVSDVTTWAAAGCQLTPTAATTTTTTTTGALAKSLRRLQPLYDASAVETDQLEAISADGTRVTYFLSRSKGSEGAMPPTLIYAYGGFGVPVLPAYQASAGAAWLERGGQYVEANLRGGGEFGPLWEEAARGGHGRLRAYEDLEAVADDLVARGYAAPGQLGLLGRSNGGLLVGNMLARELQAAGRTPTTGRFAALVGEVPLLDMQRYHLLLAGASWIDEYGNPDVASDWEELRLVSPYHLVSERLKANPGTGSLPLSHPPVLFTTSTRDDRVHPCHARKMVSLLQGPFEKDKVDAGISNAYLYESPEGGHGGAASIAERASLRTLEYEFLWQCLTSTSSAPRTQRE